MPTHTKLYVVIRRLRRAGLTYQEINDQLKLSIPKSSLSYICKGIVLDGHKAERIRRLSSENLILQREKALRANREKQTLRLTRLKNSAITKLAHSQVKDHYIALAILYLGEGGKWKSHRGLVLGSADPLIITLYCNLLNKCYGKKIEDMKCRILYRADQDLIELQQYWMGVLNLKQEQFYKTTFDSRTIGKPTKNSNYKGVCVISCSGADIQLELQFIAEYFAEQLVGH